MAKKEHRSIYRVAPIGILILVTIIFFSPVLFQGKTFYAFDILLDFFPWSSSIHSTRANNTLIGDPVNLDFPFLRFVRKWMDKGTFPLWNGSNLCGLPVPAGGISRYINPVTALSYMLLPLPSAHDMVLWFHLLGTGLFMYLYLREIELGPLPALTGALSWMFNGYVMVWFEWEIVIILAFSLPAALYFFERWLKVQSIRNCLLFTLAVGFSVGSGFPHILLYQLLFMGCYILYRYFGSGTEGQGTGERRRVLFHLTLSVSLGLLISAGFLASHLSIMGDLQRPAVPFDELFQRTGQLPFKYLVTLLFPDFYGSPIYPKCFVPGAQPYNNYNELCIYGGIPCLFLAVAAIPHFRRRHVVFYCLAALLTLTMAMGSILYYPLARFLPGLNMSTPTRILYIFGFSLSVMAALGVHHMVNGTTTRKRWVTLSLWGLLVIAGAGAALFVQTGAGIEWAVGPGGGLKGDELHNFMGDHYGIGSVILLKPLLLTAVTLYLFTIVLFAGNRGPGRPFLLLGLVVLAFDLISFGAGYNTSVPRNLTYPVTRGIRFLQEDRSLFRVITYGRFFHNSLSPYGIEDFGGYAPFYSRRIGEYIHMSQYGPGIPPPQYFSRWTFFSSFGRPLLDLMNVKYVLIPPGEGLESDKLDLVYDEEVRIYRNKGAFPRFFFAADYEVIKDPDNILPTIGQSSHLDLQGKVFLEKDPPEDLRREAGVPGHAAKYRIDLVSYRPNRIELEILSDSKGVLVIGDNYHPDWRAEVDGLSTEILRANYIMRGIPLKAGRHRVVLTFRPLWIIAGMYGTMIGWLTLFIMIGFSLRRGRASSLGISRMRRPSFC